MGYIGRCRPSCLKASQAARGGGELGKGGDEIREGGDEVGRGGVGRCWAVLRWRMAMLGSWRT